MKKLFFLICVALLPAQLCFAAGNTTTSTTSVDPSTTTTTIVWVPYLIIGSGRGTGTGYLYEPMDVDVDNGSVFVVEAYGRVQKFDLAGGFIESYGSPGEDSEGKFDEPAGVACRVTDENNSFIYVTDTKNYRVQIYWRHVNETETSANWTYFGEKLYDEYYPQSHIYFDQAAGLDADSEGVLYVANTDMDRISMFALPSNYSKVPRPKNRTEFDGSYSPDGPLKAPQGVAVYNGTVYVADTGNNMIRLFQKNGSQIISFGKQGSGQGEFILPRSLAVDEAGNIFVADTGNNRVSVYDSQGMYVTGFGGINCSTSINSRPLEAPGQFCSPGGLDVKNGSLYVADTGNNRIQVYNVTLLPEPTCIQRGDIPPCGQVVLQEVVDHINKWMIGDARLSDVIALINMWASG
ncbi:MAG: NHL repeat-containing protein [Candidatus Altiarchaeia archaeon]